MLRKLLILSLVIASLTACASVTPTSVITETPQPRIETPISQLPASETASASDLKLTIVYDNTTTNSQLKSDWGFAALVEYHGHTLLFDTGANGSILLDNMRQLSIDPGSIEAVILSHEHGDHTAGLQALLDAGFRPTVYAPSTFGDSFKQKMRNQTQLVEVTEALEIFPGVHTTRPAGSSIVEEALVVETRDGAVVITGCAHPGVAEMVRQAQAVVNGKITLLVGGFHLYQTAKVLLPPIMTEMKQLDIEKILPAHCTGNDAIALFRAEYGKNYVEGGVGSIVTF